MECKPTTREQRRQTLAKLVLGHLIDVLVFEAPPHNEWAARVHHVHDGIGGDFIAADVGLDNWPSEVLCATVALALDEVAYQSCNIKDLDAHTVAAVLGDGL